MSSGTILAGHKPWMKPLPCRSLDLTEIFFGCRTLLWNISVTMFSMRCPGFWRWTLSCWKGFWCWYLIKNIKHIVGTTEQEAKNQNYGLWLHRSHRFKTTYLALNLNPFIYLFIFWPSQTLLFARASCTEYDLYISFHHLFLVFRLSTWLSTSAISMSYITKLSTLARWMFMQLNSTLDKVDR